jgi:hypothetical protein
MPGRAKATESAKQLVERVVILANELDLESRTEVYVGRRIWGAKRRIDVVLRHRETRKTLGIECKYQGTKGSAEEKIPATIDDIRAWPIRGIVVFSGEGFSQNMINYLLSTGMAGEMDDLRSWVELYFGL